MKQFLKVLAGIAILCGVLYGVYMVVPEYPHDMIKSFVQPVFDVEAKLRIGQVKNLDVNIKGLEGITYQRALEKNTGMNCWVYNKDEAAGTEEVVFRGNGASINMKDVKDYGGKLYTSGEVKFEFHIDGTKVEIIPFIDGQEMNIKDGKHVEQNKEVLKMIVTQLATGIQDE
jgi:hypothetical protein